MQLLPDWKHILTSAWSVWLLATAVVLTGVEMVLPIFELSMPRELYAALIGLISAGALLARILVQGKSFYSDESGAVSRRTMGGIAGTAGALAIAIGLIGQWEGLRTVAYKDIVGVWTVCYGETKGVSRDDKYTVADCDKMLAKEILSYERGLDRCLKTKVPAGMKVALVSWSYNVGTGAACRSTLVRKANRGDLVGACNELTRWNRAGGRVIPGLTNRRIAERDMCLKAVRAST